MEDYTEMELLKPDESENEMQKIYCGPNLLRHGLMSYQVFLGGYPANVKAIMTEIPEVEKLMVDVRDADEVRGRILKKGTLENLYYERIKGKAVK